MRELHSGLVKYLETVVAGLWSTPVQSQPAGKKWARKTGKRQRDSTWGCVLACLHMAVLWAPADIMRITLYLTLFLLTLSVYDSSRALLYFLFLGNNSLSWAQSQTAATVSVVFLVLPTIILSHTKHSSLQSTSYLYHFLSLSVFLALILWLASLQFIVLWRVL